MKELYRTKRNLKMVIKAYYMCQSDKTSNGIDL